MKSIFKNIKVLLLTLLLLISSISIAQERAIVRGKVTSDFEPQGVVGATVAELDQNNRLINGTVTNLDGDFLLEVRDNTNKLQFTSVGYKTLTVDIDKKSVIRVTLEDDVTELEGAEIVGYRRVSTGTLSVADRDLAIPVAKISTEEFEGVQASSIDEALQGRLSGVDITANSGDPGAGMSIRIRGVNTLSVDASPLIVVDNIPYEVNVSSDFNFATANEEGYSQMLNIPVDDIAEISVLKDAAATAMWGTRAANGVLLITTKRGSLGRKPSVQYTFRGTYTQNPPTIPLLNGNEYNTLMQEGYYNSFKTPMPFDVYREFLRSPDEPYYFYNYGADTDWMSALTRDGYIQNHDFSLTGGGNKAFYRFSVNYQGQEGTTIGTSLERISTRLNLDYNISDKLRMRADFAYTNSDTHGNYTDDQFKNNNALRAVGYRKMPIMSIYEYDVNGNITPNYFTPESNSQGTAPSTYNPVAMGNEGFTRTLNDRITSKLSAYYDIIPGLRYTLDLSFDVNTNKVNKFMPQTATGKAWTDLMVNKAYDKDDDSYYIYTNNQLNFTKNINTFHDISAAVNFITNQTVGNYYELTGANSASSLLQDPSIDNKFRDAGLGFKSGPWRGRDIGLTGVLHYKLMDKYIVSGSMRLEGNSKFDTKNRYGLFKAISGAWRISSEPFLEDQDWLDDLRLRFSYGENGNKPKYEGMYFNNYSTFAWDYLGYNSVYSADMRLVDLKWEAYTSYNYGLSFDALDSRVGIEMDYYLNRTKDMFGYDVKIPSSSGLSKVNIMNIGTMDNVGWDFSLRTLPVKKKDFSMTFDINIAKNYNILRKVADGYPLERNVTLGNGLYKNIIQIDNPIGSFYGYRYKGVYTHEDQLIARDINGEVIRNPNGEPVFMVFDYDNIRYNFELGDAMYEDINHDGNINTQDIVYLGDANPDFTGGFGSLMKYKNVSFNYFFYFRYGNDIINRTRMNGENMYSFDNQLKSTLSRWRIPGDETDIPRAMHSGGYNWLGSDRFVEDGSFLRLKYITITYNLPRKFTDKIRASSSRVSVTANNLLTFTKYTGQDPEINIRSKDGSIYTVGYDDSSTPVAKQLTLNFSITF